MSAQPVCSRPEHLACLIVDSEIVSLHEGSSNAVYSELGSGTHSKLKKCVSFYLDQIKTASLVFNVCWAHPHKGKCQVPRFCFWVRSLRSEVSCPESQPRERPKWVLSQYCVVAKPGQPGFRLSHMCPLWHRADVHLSSPGSSSSKGRRPSLCT